MHANTENQGPVMLTTAPHSIVNPAIFLLLHLRGECGLVLVGRRGKMGVMACGLH